MIVLSITTVLALLFITGLIFYRLGYNAHKQLMDDIVTLRPWDKLPHD